MNQSPQESPLDILLLTNTAANRGRAAETGREAKRHLERAGHEVQYEIPENVAATQSLVREAVSLNKRIIAVGGDGFIHHAVQGCVETSAILGVIPAGTGNDFASGLGLPQNLERAVKAAAGPPKGCDVLKFESSDGQIRFGTSIATAGFSAAVNIQAESMRWPRGPFKYTVATLMKVARLERYDFDVAVDGVPVSGRCLFIAIANTRSFGGGMQIAPNANASTGTADLVIIHDTSALELLRMLPKTFKGAHINHPAVQIISGARFEVQMLEARTSRPCRLRADGEDVGSLPQTVTVLSGGLRVAGVLHDHIPENEARDTNE